MMVLVIDVQKGIQTQTAECLVVGEITTDILVVALNKVDMLPEDTREQQLDKLKKKLAATFAATRFRGCTMVPVAAKPGGGTEMVAGGASLGVESLVNELVARVPDRVREPSAPFLFAIDHCFAIRGHGTVLTGTVLQGRVEVNDEIELPELKVTKKVKSMQMFRKPVNWAIEGDRVGICVTQLDASAIERGLACRPGTVPTFSVREEPLAGPHRAPA